MKLSVEEIKAVAGAAITARHAADQAKQAADAAEGTDEALNAAYTEAERIAGEAKAKADALSQEDADDPIAKKRAKLIRKKQIIGKELAKLGAGEDDDEDDEDADEDDDIDPDRPLTLRDINKIEAKKLQLTVQEMVKSIPDAGDQQAVREALRSVVASGDPAADFKKAVAIANADRNSKVLQEAGRRIAAQPRATSSGAAPIREEAFTPTAEEARYMKAPFFVTKEDIVKARKAGAQES